MCFYGVWLKCWLIFTWSWTYLISWEYWIRVSLWFVDNTCMIWQFFFSMCKFYFHSWASSCVAIYVEKMRKQLDFCVLERDVFFLRAALQSQCYQEKNYKYVISLQMKEQKLVLCTCSLAISDKRRNRSKT